MKGKSKSEELSCIILLNLAHEKGQTFVFYKM